MKTRNWFVFNNGGNIGSVLLGGSLSGIIFDEFSLGRAHDRLELGSRVVDFRIWKQSLLRVFLY